MRLPLLLSLIVGVAIAAPLDTPANAELVARQKYPIHQVSEICCSKDHLAERFFCAWSYPATGCNPCPSDIVCYEVSVWMESFANVCSLYAQSLEGWVDSC
ncbi:hypothetical protein HBI04_110190 [Parastagonospora nodorum]|nr:hypothetical protein HBI04_110190 [Parastagonospora nodorum]KAH5660161.1 hypothetical protein HBI23_130970 [Parastagonospora nodorum]KAH6488747.1 hypothetical protein HBI55_170370 [Parastagonospora nodorum]